MPDNEQSIEQSSVLAPHFEVMRLEVGAVVKRYGSTETIKQYVKKALITTSSVAARAEHELCQEQHNSPIFEV